MHQKAAAVLPELELRMKELNVTADLGLCLNWMHFLSAPSELLIEETNEQNRVQVFFHRKAPAGTDTAIVTQWLFGDEEDASSRIKKVACMKQAMCYPNNQTGTHKCYKEHRGR